MLIRCGLAFSWFRYVTIAATATDPEEPSHQLDDEDRAELQTLFDEEDPDAQSYLKDKAKYAANLK